MLAKGGTSYHNDQIGMSIRNGSSTIDAFTRTPDGQPIDQRMKDKTTGTINRYYYVTDGLGSVVALVDQAGSTTPVSTYKYDPYGNDAGTTGTVTSRFRFAGGYLSTSLGLYKFGERWYDPSTGRWLQQDMLEDPLAQKGWNRYDYAGDDPVNNVDLSGTSFRKWLKLKYRAGLSSAYYSLTTGHTPCITTSTHTCVGFQGRIGTADTSSGTRVGRSVEICGRIGSSRSSATPAVYAMRARDTTTIRSVFRGATTVTAAKCWIYREPHRFPLACICTRP